MKLFLVVLPLALFHIVTANSSGASGCAGGRSAAFHPPGTTGNLEDGKFELVLDDNEIVASGDSPVLETDRDYRFAVRSTDGTKIRGVLFRMEMDNTLAFGLEPGPNLQPASVCRGPELGVTHTSADDKDSVEAVFTPMEAGTATLDLTIVVSNSAPLGSIYYYSQFIFSVADSLPAVPSIPEAPAANTTTPFVPTFTDECWSAQNISNSITQGSIDDVVFYNESSIDACDYNVSRGVWYQHPGDGSLLTVEVCSTDFNAHVAVFAGNCAEPVCLGVGSHTEDCAFFAWPTLQDHDYLVLVHAMEENAIGEYYIDFDSLSFVN